ncbi:MAG: RDD family protein [Bacteroidota bacterium]|nr:RDD family protein [Bacteroidota bacterium]
MRNCLWRSTPFVNLPLLPKNFQPLNNKQFWNSEDDALTSVVTDITDSINAFSDYAAAQAPPPVEEKHTAAPSIEKNEPFPPSAAFTENREQQRGPDVAKPATPPRQFAQQKKFVALDENWRGQYYKDVLWKRAAAFFLDNLLTMFPVMFIAFAMASVAVVDPDENVSDEKVSYILFFTFSLYFIVCAIMESSKWRGTFGKRIMKLQITDKDGHPVSFGRALWRNIVRWIVGYSYLLIFPLIIQYFTFKKSKQLFHDQLSKTVIGERLKK